MQGRCVAVCSIHRSRVSRPHMHCSGDVGLGLNARRLRDRLLNQFVVTYSLRPIGDLGSVYRRYPGLWQVRCPCLLDPPL